MNSLIHKRDITLPLYERHYVIQILYNNIIILFFEASKKKLITIIKD